MNTLFYRVVNGFPGAIRELAPSTRMPNIRRTNAATVPGQGSSPYASVTLDALVEEVRPLPQGSILIGACDDQGHFYLDLRDPSPGSILIAAKGACGPTRLLQSILSSAALLNSQRRLRYAYLSVELEWESPVLRQPYCYRAESTSSTTAGQLITQLADLAESRAGNGRSDTSLVLAINGLDSLCTHLEDHAYDDLAWLLQYGPTVNIWTFATLDVRYTKLLDVKLLDLFGTHLLGAMDAKMAAIFQANASITRHLIPNKQFCVWFDNQWLSFWVPMPAGYQQNLLQ